VNNARSAAPDLVRVVWQKGSEAQLMAASLRTGNASAGQAGSVAGTDADTPAATKPPSRTTPLAKAEVLAFGLRRLLGGAGFF
jgi:hypothetical protein